MLSVSGFWILWTGYYMTHTHTIIYIYIIIALLTAGFSSDCLACVLSCKSSTWGSDCLVNGSSNTVNPNWSLVLSGRVTYNTKHSHSKSIQLVEYYTYYVHVHFSFKNVVDSNKFQAFMLSHLCLSIYSIIHMCSCYDYNF